jgi:hypothetical protein
MAEPDMLWVRIKPRNEKRGLKLRRYMAYGMRFLESEGWYKVGRWVEMADGTKKDVGAYLRQVRNDNDDPDSPFAFDVMSEAEARSLDAEERKRAEERVSAIDARPVRPAEMTSADLRPPVYDATYGDETAADEPLTARAQPVKRPRGRPRKNPLPPT